MSKPNKSPKKRNKKRTFRPKKSSWSQPNAIDARGVLGDIMLEASDVKESIIVYETPFGKISAGEGMEMYSIKNKALLLDILAMNDSEHEEPLDELIQVEKLKDKYPNEPYIYHEIGNIYRRLGEKGKFAKLAISNYERFKGYIDIDMDYFEHVYKTGEGVGREEVKEKIFGTALNLHEIYPKTKAFEERTVFYFYTMLATYYIHEKNYQLAKDCTAVIRAIRPNSVEKLETMIRIKEDAVYRWKQFAMFGGIILLILAIIGGIIYGIVKFFQWIF